jgi:2-(1,2-epoxy-1,2-dihydrophenyl)acetyl-CoA isomerase
VGGGLALAMLCDMRIMAEDARLIPAFGAMGFFPGLGLTYSLERLLGPTKALEVFYMGTPIAAQEALALGLCSKVTTKEDLMDEARHMAATIASNSHFVNRMLKSAIMSGYRGELRQRLERDILAQVLTSVSEDYKERRAAIARERSTK